MPFDAPRGRKLYDDISWLPRRGKEINRGGEGKKGEGGVDQRRVVTRTATGTPDELVDLGN